MERHHIRRLRRQKEDRLLQFLGMRCKPRGGQICNVLRLRPVGQRQPHRHRRCRRQHTHQIRRQGQDVPQYRNKSGKQHRPRLLGRQRQKISRMGKLERHIHLRTCRGRTKTQGPLEKDHDSRHRLRRSHDTQTRQPLLSLLQRRKLLRRTQQHLPLRRRPKHQTFRPISEQDRRQDARQQLHHRTPRKQPLDSTRPQQRNNHR